MVFMRLSRYGFQDGLRDGLPIALGYLSVSFGFGVSAVSLGLSWLQAALISITNLTSAGQVAGVSVIAAAGSLGEMALTQLVINIRYLLMSVSLSQRLDDGCSLPHRFALSFAITDEIFAVSSAKPDLVGKEYMYGLIVMPIIGWTAGTALGGAAGSLLPAAVSSALGIAIYGMFVAIVVPAARQNGGVLLCAALSILLSCLIHYLPAFSGISAGFSVIICAVLGAGLAALINPVEQNEESEAQSE